MLWIILDAIIVIMSIIFIPIGVIDFIQTQNWLSLWLSLSDLGLAAILILNIKYEIMKRKEEKEND